MDRRQFLVAAAAGAAGLEGILAARRAPAFAQGTKIHLLRWNDFIPACDVILREKLLPEAGKALGAEARRSSSRRSTPTIYSRASPRPSSRAAVRTSS